MNDAETTRKLNVANDDDILIVLKEELRAHQESEFMLSYETIDQKSHFPPGSTKKHIAQAADECGIDVVRQGESYVELRRRPIQTRLVRG